MRYIPLLLILPILAGAHPIEGPARPNVLLLTVDSFRPDRLGCYGYERAHTPNIDRLAGEGVLFTRAFSTAPWTNPSNVSMLTGLYPGVHGVERRGLSAPEALDTPQEAMARAGIAVPEINYLFPMPNYTNLGFTPTRIRDLEEFLAEYRDSTFFAWYHFHGPHLPYSPPKAWIERFLPGGAAESKAVSAVMKDMIMPRGEYSFSKREQDLVSALYDGEVAAQDEQIGRVLEILDSLGLTGKTIVVLSSDHGEELFDHGWLGHASTSLNGTLFDESIRIPLIISLPDRLPRGRVVRQQVQSVDLMPTLFELMGLEWKGPCQGVSLMPVIGSGGGPAEKKMRPVVFCQSSACGYQCDAAQEPVWLRCVRTERYKLVQTTEPGREPAYSLYDLETDPGETGDIAGEKPAVLRQLLLMLHEHIFKNAMLRDSILAAGAVKNLRPGTAPEYRRCEILAPAEGAGLTFKSGNGAVHISWTGPGEGEYRIEYVVGRGKYHLDDSFTSIGNKKEFGPFNRIFWNALKLYNPWRFRVMPKHRPELASQWRSFTFE